MALRKKSFGSQCNHSRSSCIISSFLQNIFRPNAPLGGRRSDNLRQEDLDCMNDVAERSISVSGWCAWCEEPRVDGRYNGEMTLTFTLFFSCSWWLPLLGLRNVLSNIQCLLYDAVWGNPLLPNECIVADTILTCYGSPHEVHSSTFPFLTHCSTYTHYNLTVSTHHTAS